MSFFQNNTLQKKSLDNEYNDILNQFYKNLEDYKNDINVLFIETVGIIILFPVFCIPVLAIAILDSIITGIQLAANRIEYGFLALTHSEKDIPDIDITEDSPLKIA